MKRIVLVIGLLLLSTPVYAQSATASWDPVTLDVLGGPETISHYTLYWGTTTRPGGVIHPSDAAFAYDTLADVGNVTTYQVDNLVNGNTYFFSVVAEDVAGNVSDYSDEASIDIGVEDCNNLLDDDHDGLTDCQDDECPNQTEECDGFDNDCDGTADNNLTPPLCAEQDGVCAGSTQSCGGTPPDWQACDASSYGSDYEAPEATCDGLDNDCDDSTDEDLTAPACLLQLGVCAGSTKTCGGTPPDWQVCDASNYGGDYQAVETTCDNMDNDCDGSTDEDCPCTAGEQRTCSSNVGECVEGNQTCDNNGNWGACDGTMPTNEICDGKDNDCDDSTDNNLTPPACALQDGVCQGSAQACGGTSGWLACDYGNDFEIDETRCDGLDNDCDDSTDEALTPPACALQEGVCQGAVPACGGTSGWLACDYGSDYEAPEATCDGLDNDCDGETDEGDICQACTQDSDCQDDLFCTGTDTCEGGSCAHTGDPCGTGETCNEADDTCDAVDGGLPDAGTDAGTGTDGGTGAVEGSCGCDVFYRPGISQGSTGSSGAAWLPLLLILFAIRRRQ